MSSLFADTHNVVAILEKSDAAEGFEQIIDFLSGSYIYYALMVSPHIYISCIKQFWNFVLVKRLGDVTSAKRTSWNEFSTAMASAVICLSKGQRFSFSKYIFDSLVRNVDSSSKFYMVGKGFSGVETPLFEGMIADRQPTEKELGAEQVQVDAAIVEDVVEDVAEDVAHRLEIVKLKARVKKLEQTDKVKPLKFRRLRKVGASRQVESSDKMEDVFNQGRMMNEDEGIKLVKDAKIAEFEGRQADKQAEIYNIDLDHSLKVLSMQVDDSEVQDVVEVVTTAKLMTEVVTVAASQGSAASATIPA
nr:hypothetical protein [Tanacetum cinerariifolium]